MSADYPDDDKRRKIQLKVVFQGRTLYFSTKRTSSLRRLIDAAADRLGIDRDAVRFQYNGITLRGDERETPQELDMEEDDEIDVHIEQIGGYGPCDNIDARRANAATGLLH
ncbi:hypothetical protein SERLA73DRAFT_139979 [Serpula lacrymans var. lacrymans S7.3]|uniref:Ubiquitin-like domain-containing protein n=2 Tax=Serpula lacrymans var. lacrymans TaxID=341189 RepID=F8Q388_SERL3|nr:uncharacterized protein SERLADRAFT_394432 [Serpula lacrymans var. lacrymans S7.9]EGN97649.1 hypothetical protein SERLA73DRAFT_139979 [Serpula lacrymans var. lacrymans S7.3]EGO23243.1 hypothetical protein SERLADRAFT_394432 [Serpula lacrymans var. lacrymans S7.9]